MNPLTLKENDGPLTRELIQQPGDFGLGKVPARLKPASTTTSICGFCATGCQLNIHLDKQGQAINLTPKSGYPVNLGMACPKGWQALDPLDAPDRATSPLLRNSKGEMEEVGWDGAMEAFVSKLKGIQKDHGRESVAFLSTGQIPFEEMAFLGCLFKFGMGFLHGDANTRQCMATAVMAYKQSFGFDAPPASYADFEESDVIVLVGANLCIAHPILWQRVMRNKRNPKIIVIDPRSTETAQAATQHIPLNPKGDLALFQALTHCIIRDGRTDAQSIANTEGYEEMTEFVSELDPLWAAPKTGMSPEAIEALAKTVSEPGKRVSWWWTMGVNQSHEGVRCAQAIINLALITGNIGKPGTGANSITGQCNAMGSRLFSNTTSLVGGHDFAVAEHRAKVAEGLDIPIERIPHDPSLAYDQILTAVKEGRIKGLWIVATNPFHSWVDAGALEHIRSNLEFLIVQDMYRTTESAQCADLVLPAAGWGEKEGCFINSERRLATTKVVSRAPGKAMSDFRIFKLIAEAWGCGELFSRWTHPEAVFHILRNLTRDRPCDITGIEGYDHLDDRGGIQWPYPIDSPPEETERRLYADGRFYTPSGKARLLYSPHAEMPEMPDDKYPMILLTGRGTSSQWHTQSRTAKSIVLSCLAPAKPYLELHPGDAAEIDIQQGDLIEVQTRRGSLEVEAYLAPTVQRGQVFLPMHYHGVNRLTHPTFDPHSRQPSYKACACRIQNKNGEFISLGT